MMSNGISRNAIYAEKWQTSAVGQRKRLIERKARPTAIRSMRDGRKKCDGQRHRSQQKTRLQQMGDEPVEEQLVCTARKTESPSGGNDPCKSTRELITFLYASQCADIEQRADHNSKRMEG